MGRVSGRDAMLMAEALRRGDNAPFVYLVQLNAEDLEGGGLSRAADLGLFATQGAANEAGSWALGREVDEVEAEYGAHCEKAPMRPGPVAEYLVMRFSEEHGTDEEWRCDDGGFGSVK